MGSASAGPAPCTYTCKESQRRGVSKMTEPGHREIYVCIQYNIYIYIDIDRINRESQILHTQWLLRWLCFVYLDAVDLAQKEEEALDRLLEA